MILIIFAFTLTACGTSDIVGSVTVGVDEYTPTVEEQTVDIYTQDNVYNEEKIETEEYIFAEDEGKHIYHMSTLGDDATADGSFEKPFATLQGMKDFVSSILATSTEDIVIYMRGGTYFSNDIVEFDTSDNYANGSITYKAYNGHTPSISGGTVVESEWTEVEGVDGMWQVSLEDIDPVEDVHNGEDSDLHEDKLYVREFYVDNQYQKRSTTEDFLNQNSPTSSQWYDATPDDDSSDNDGIAIRVTEKNTLPEAMFERDENGELKDKYLESSFTTTWRNYRITITDLVKTEYSDSDFYAFTYDDRYYGALCGLSPENQYLSPLLQFKIENSLCLVDTETEWYYDVDTKIMYYMSVDGSDPNESLCVIPTSEKLLDFSGDETEKVEGIHFDGITFENATILDASVTAWYGWQGTHLVVPFTQEPGSIEFTYTEDLSFTNCIVRNVSSGLNFLDANENIVIDGCLFYDMSGTAIKIGYNNQQIDNTYATTEIAEQVINREFTISNNVFSQMSLMYLGDSAIHGYYIKDVDILHNEFYDQNGFSVQIGWGWGEENRYEMYNNNVMYNSFTRVQQVMKDGAAVYVLGRSSNSFIANNFIDDAGLSYGSLYCDDGSTYWTVENNVSINCEKALHFWTDSISFLTVRNNYANTQDGTYSQNENCYVELPILIDADNMPPEALAITQFAGLEDTYSSLETLKRNLVQGIM